MHSALAATATLLSIAFAAATFERFLDRPGALHHAAWSAALVCFAVASAALWCGASLGWAPWSFRLFFGFGAIVDVPLLALGTVYLLAGRRAGHLTAAGVGLSAAWALGVMTTCAVGALPRGGIPRGADVLGPLPRVLAGVGSGAGALVLFAGAIWSAGRLVRRRVSRRLAAANGLIAVGTLVLSAGGLFNGTLGQMDAFSVSLVAGIAVLFVGFLLTTPGSARPPAALPRSGEPGPARLTPTTDRARRNR